VVRGSAGEGVVGAGVPARERSVSVKTIRTSRAAECTYWWVEGNPRCIVGIPWYGIGDPIGCISQCDSQCVSQCV
jgi:hypothetical protein